MRHNEMIIFCILGNTLKQELYVEIVLQIFTTSFICQNQINAHTSLYTMNKQYGGSRENFIHIFYRSTSVFLCFHSTPSANAAFNRSVE